MTEWRAEREGDERRGQGMKFIELTDTAGHKVWFGVEWIAMVREPRPSEFYATTPVKAVVEMSGRVCGVRETVEQIMAAFRRG